MTPPLTRKTSDVVADTAANKTPATGDEAGLANNSFFMFDFCKKKIITDLPGEQINDPNQ